MDTKKLVIFQVLIFISMAYTSFLYLNKGLAPLSYTWEYVATVSPVLILHLILFFIGLLVTLSFVVARTLYKKNLLRVSILLLILLAVVSIIGRIVEAVTLGYVCWLCVLAIMLYIILIALNYVILKDLYDLIEELFSHRR